MAAVMRASALLRAAAPCAVARKSQVGFIVRRSPHPSSSITMRHSSSRIASHPQFAQVAFSARPVRRAQLSTTMVRASYAAETKVRGNEQGRGADLRQRPPPAPHTHSATFRLTCAALSPPCRAPLTAWSSASSSSSRRTAPWCPHGTTSPCTPVRNCIACCSQERLHRTTSTAAICQC